MLRLFFIIGLLALSFGSYAAEESVSIAEAAKVEPIEITVYRSPTCGCCGKWIAHLKENNFQIKDIVTEDMQEIKDKYGVPKEMASCHTAIIDGYVIEGHVPANDIKVLLKMKPAIIGISVPGMPVGTPGMEMGGKKDAYKVIGFDKNKQYQIFNSYEAE